MFSGCGGLDLGLKKSGFELVWANEINEQFANIYKYNILDDVSISDIRDIDEKTIPDCDVVAAGFPCQSFSSAGKRLGVKDERGNLFFECLRVIKEKQPIVVILENVRGILSIKNTDGSLFVNTIIKSLENLDPGYAVNYKLLRASDYGVPQNRFRVIFIGIRKDFNISYRFPPITHNGNEKELTVARVINVPPNTPNQDEHWELSPQYKQMIPLIKEGGSWKDIPYDLLPDRFKKIRDNMKKYKSPNFYRRFARTEINGTITAAATPENCGIIHPLENRRYTVREIARFQSFPDDFIFVGSSISMKYQAIGNAVPPKLAEAIGKSVMNSLNGNDNEEHIKHGIYPKQLSLL